MKNYLSMFIERFKKQIDVNFYGMPLLSMERRVQLSLLLA